MKPLEDLFLIRVLMSIATVEFFVRFLLAVLAFLLFGCTCLPGIDCPGKYGNYWGHWKVVNGKTVPAPELNHE